VAAVADAPRRFRLSRGDGVMRAEQLAGFDALIL
jgi:hypothetical protein